MENPNQDIVKDAAALAAADAGDEAAWSRLTEPYRPELRVHGYRMLGSFADADDVVQDALLRAWRSRATYEARGSLRAWLYGITTRACLDFLAKSQRQQPGPRAGAIDESAPVEVPWLEPYPDRLLDAAGPRVEQPDAKVVARETIGLAFLIAIQWLPAKQRAALILCDVLDWSAKEAAELLELSVAALNSALQRARATLATRQPELLPEWKPTLDPDVQQRQLLLRIVTATERGDVAALAATLREDIRFSMPPQPGTWAGRDTVVDAWVKGGFGSEAFGQFRCLVTRANRMPAVACYVRKPGETKFRPMALDVLQIEDGLVKEIVTFPLHRLFAAFALPAEL